MDYAKEERIGDPDLFTGRKEEMAYFLKWINDIKERKSMSTAIMARRKMGKTSLMERRSKASCNLILVLPIISQQSSTHHLR